MTQEISRKNLRTKALSWEVVNTLSKFIILATIASAAPIIGGHQQFITGPIVNAMLFLAVITVGVRQALLICFIPSVFALSVGLVPAVLAPVVPFIMISNAILVLVFEKIWKKNFIIGVGLASLLKFSFLFASSQVVVNLFVKEELAKKAVVMFSWPQLVTAFMGGAIALVAWKVYQVSFERKGK
ncbi:iron hydrogenase [bacterium (Candidatus Torokbacteria) CG_4_10_14_0_2_um_filter_35_8]|nr:MAG: iron hydrogenase [bacterium (Candidatus Torokbacteria) CG_4_10_14_0_2_um_filter_35_8]